jgi:DNA polymerase III delta prime subunit
LVFFLNLNIYNVIKLSTNLNITISGVYELIQGVISPKSTIEYLGLKNISILRHYALIFEIIQQRRKFICEYGHFVPYNLSSRSLAVDDAMLKLAKILSDKNMKYNDFLNYLSDKTNKNDPYRILAKEEMISRIREFEARITVKDSNIIYESLSNKNSVFYR